MAVRVLSYGFAVSDRLEAAVSQVLDDGLRTGDIYKEGFPNTRKALAIETGSVIAHDTVPASITFNYLDLSFQRGKTATTRQTHQHEGKIP
eukprot:670568-Pelagomonas_calceolata.AAC.2